MFRHLKLWLFAFFFCVGCSHGQQNTSGSTLRVAFPYHKAIQEYDPLRIVLAPEYIFLENIYSTLVEISPKGELVPAVASRFEWVGDQAVFTIRNDLKTVDGTVITAEDVAFSLKRLIILAGQTHGHIRDLLCPNTTLKSVDDSCSGIAVKNNELILSPGGKKVFLFPMLASIDFAIIPRTSVDPKTLAIRDYRNTSGAYFVSKDQGNGNLVLQANQGHFHFTPNMPQQIAIVPTDSGDPKASLQEFEQNKVDFLTTVDAARPEDVIAFARRNADANLHVTLNIRTMTISFTRKGIAATKSEQRRAIGNAVRKAFNTYIIENHIEGYTPVEQYFSVFGEAGLSADELAILHTDYTDHADAGVPAGLKMQVVRVGGLKLWHDMLSPILPGIDIGEGKILPAFDSGASEDTKPDFIITGPDTGWMEDIGLISYTMNAEYFGLSHNEGSQWVENYMKTDDKNQRLKMLRAVHYQALHDAILVPFAGAPYVALARKPWDIGLSTFFANNQFWLITQKDTK